MIVERDAARTLLIADRAVLLIKGCDPARPEAGEWWLTPGGGIEESESPEEAAAREVLEETGLSVTADQMGPVVATRTSEFEFDRLRYRQREWYFAVAVEHFTPAADGWNAIEQQALLATRWWTVEDLLATEETLYPPRLAELLRAVVLGTLTAPIELA